MTVKLKYISAERRSVLGGTHLKTSLKALFVFAGILLPWSVQAAEPVTLVYPCPVSNSDHRSEYPLQLLELALEKSGQNYQLKPSEFVMNKARVAAELATDTLDVGWMVTSNEREQKLLPVRICIFKGLGGWRLALVTRESVSLFAGITNLHDLQNFTAGQQADWPDTTILRDSGLQVVTTSNYDPLFLMLILKRIDWFPRNILEIWNEADAYEKKGIVVEPHVLVRYPSAYYFFVNKNNHALAGQIKLGLEKALKDGSFDRLLLEYHGDVIKKANIDSRLIIDLPNRVLPPETPLNRKELWFQLSDD